MKDALLRVARATGLFALCRWWTRDQLRILCYHGVWIGPAPHYGDRLFMSPARFADRMQLIERLGYRVIGLDEAVQRHVQGRSRARDLVITIDDAWLGTFLHMLPVLEQRGYPSTLYVPTYYVEARRPVLNVLLGYLMSRPSGNALLADLVPAEVPAANRLAHLVQSVEALPNLDDRWREVKRIAEQLPDAPAIDAIERAFRLMEPEQLREASLRGMDIQLHTHTHRMHGQVPDRVAAEIERNRQHLAIILNRDPSDFQHFCYPSGDYDAATFSSLDSVGIRSATTTEFGLVSAGLNPLMLPRILDGETLSDLEFEAQLSGFWSLASSLKALVRGRS